MRAVIYTKDSQGWGYRIGTCTLSNEEWSQYKLRADERGYIPLNRIPGQCIYLDTGQSDIPHDTLVYLD